MQVESESMQIGQQVVIDGWSQAVVCDVRDDGSFYTARGDNVRERWQPGADRVTSQPNPQ